MRKTLILAAMLVAAPALADTVNRLRTVDEFEGIEAESERSVAYFDEMLKVIQHPRCLNCHPVDNSPRQGMEMQMHEPPVVRGANDFGAPGMRCTTCHGTENVEFTTKEGSIPGHEPWQLAPLETGWIGRAPPRSAPSSRTPSATAAAAWRSCTSTTPRTGWSAGAGTPARAANRRRARRRSSAS